MSNPSPVHSSSSSISNPVAFQQTISARQQTRQSRLNDIKAKRSETEKAKLAAMEADRQKLLDDEKRKAKEERDARVRERKRVEDDRRKKEDAIKKEREDWDMAEKVHRKILVKKGVRGFKLILMAIGLGMGRADEWHRRRVQSRCLSEMIEELKERFKDRKRANFEIEMDAELRYIKTVKK